MLRYGVIGVGAIGGYYDSKLAYSGQEVHFLSHSDYEFVKERGMQVDSCEVLESLYVPESWKDLEAGDIFNCMPFTIDNFCHWDRPYVDEVFDVNDYWCDEDKTEKDEFGVVYANEGRRLISAYGSAKIGKHYYVPDGVLTICDGAFMGIDDYLELSVPRSIKVIGDFIFGEESGKIVIRD